MSSTTARSRNRSRNRSRLAALIRTPIGITALIMLTVLVLFAAFAPVIWGDAADLIDTDKISQGPSLEHLFGTDDLGRDLLSRVLVATRLSLLLALAATSMGVVLGVLLGAVPWIFGRRGSAIGATVVNIAVAFPSLLLALYFAVIFGVGIAGAVGAIGLATAPTFARLTQTLIAGIQEREFVAAARLTGQRRPAILFRHVLPNIAEPLAISATMSAGGALLSFAGLSFLGLGVQAPEYDWGVLLSQGLANIYVQPLSALGPGVAIVFAGLTLNLVGEVVAKGMGWEPSQLKPQAIANVIARLSAIRNRDAPPSDELLRVRELTVAVPTPAGYIDAVRGVSFDLRQGEAVGVVGESGSGKSLTALAVSRLLERPVASGAEELRFRGTDLLGLNRNQTNAELGMHLGVIFQDPGSSLNPTLRVGPQVSEGLRAHTGISRKAARDASVKALDDVRVPLPEKRAHQYPHEFSGGMKQRAMIAMATMGNPSLIIADEPTTALDVTIQKQILDLLRAIREQSDTALLFISHDLAVVTQVCDRVLVMYAGRIVEELPVEALVDDARHPYTRALVATNPAPDVDKNVRLAVIPGRAPDPATRPTGCSFAPRCAFATDRCRTTEPPLVRTGADRRVACWRADELFPVEEVATHGHAAV